MTWAAEAELEDEYGLCEGVELFWRQEHEAASWIVLAEHLLGQLNHMRSAKGRDRDLRDYRRGRLTRKLVRALEHAGRPEDAIPLCQREAGETGSYPLLVHQLVEAGRWQEAEEWAQRGITATWEQWPGIASQLRTTPREIRERANDWPYVAALRAEDFFQEPTLETFRELEKAARRAGLWTGVRVAAMRYLETGQFPWTTEAAVEDESLHPWPLPETGLRGTTRLRRIDPPMTGALVDIAIVEKRPDDVTRWYDASKATEAPLGSTAFQHDKVAKAVQDTYPERALAIWKALAEAQIAQTQPRAYEVAVAYLRQVQRLLEKLGRGAEWQRYVEELRQANARKRRLLEMLDRLAARPILEER